MSRKKVSMLIDCFGKGMYLVKVVIRGDIGIIDEGRIYVCGDGIV